MMGKKILYMVAVMALILPLLICACGKKQENLDELLRLGQRYLTEENYDEAVVVFEKAIAIDDKCVAAYAGMADAYMGQGDTGKAVEILERGYNITRDQALSDQKQEYEADMSSGGDDGQTPVNDDRGGMTQESGVGTGQEAGQESEQPYDPANAPKEAQSSEALEELRSLIESGGYAQAGELADSDDIRKLVLDAGGPVILVLSGDPLSGFGTGLGIYRINDELYGVYLGEYSGGRRSGQGRWVFGTEAYFEGAWARDAPNGAGKIVTYGYGESQEGNFQDGRFDGTILFSFQEGDSVQCQFGDGKPVVQGQLDPGTVEPGNPFIYIISLGDNQFCCSAEQADQLWGVPGFTPEIMY